MNSTINIFRYEPIRRLGRGGLGDVYLARDRLFGREVALKLINWGRLGVSAPAHDSFRNKIINNFAVEAKAHARLSELTNHIVQVFDMGYEDAQHYLAMEFMPAGDLTSIDGPCSLTHTKQIVRQVASGLAVAHDNGVLHCDISPHNILAVDTGGPYKLSDLGLLTLVNTHLVSNGGPSLLHGGKQYWQPVRVLTGEEAPSPWSDLYSLALILHWLLTKTQLRIVGGSPDVREPLRQQGVDLSPSIASMLRGVFDRSISDCDTFIQRLDRLT